MVNSVSTVRNNTVSARRFDRPKTPTSVLTDAVNSQKPMLGAQLFRQTGDESREQFFSTQENTALADAEGNTPAAQNPTAALSQSVQARFAKAATNPKQFQSLLKQALGENYSSDGAETIRQQTLEGDFSWMPAVDEGSSFSNLVSGENIDSESLSEPQNEVDSGSTIGNANEVEVAFSFLKKRTIEAKKLIEKLGRTANENVAQPLKQQAERAGDWANENLAQPLKRQAERAGSWVNDNVAQPIKQQGKRFIGWGNENVAQPVKQQAARLGSWTAQSVIQPISSGAKQLAGWVGDNVLQPAIDAGTAVLRGAVSVVDITIAQPIKQGADLLGEFATNALGAAQSVWSEAQATFKGIFSNAAAPGNLGPENDAGLSDTNAAASRA